MDGARVPLTAAGTRLSIVTITSGFGLLLVKLYFGRTDEPHNKQKRTEWRRAAESERGGQRLASNPSLLENPVIKEAVHENQYAGYQY